MLSFQVLPIHRTQQFSLGSFIAVHLQPLHIQSCTTLRHNILLLPHIMFNKLLRETVTSFPTGHYSYPQPQHMDSEECPSSRAQTRCFGQHVYRMHVSYKNCFRQMCRAWLLLMLLTTVPFLCCHGNTSCHGSFSISIQTINSSAGNLEIFDGV